jgi:hypothetical protein
MQTSASRASRPAVRAAVAVLIALSGSACATSPSSFDPAAPEGSTDPIAAIDTAVPDANVDADVARRWVARAQSDSQTSVPAGNVLVPLFVNAESGASIVVLGDYSSGSQVLARYAGDDPASAELVEVEYPSSMITGLSAWEEARVRAALSVAPSTGSLAPARMTVLSMSWDGCPDQAGACAIVRLDDPDHPTPSDAPALVPRIAVRLSDGAILPIQPGSSSSG